MKAILSSFYMLIRNISRDGMLLVILCSPIAIVILIHWVVPQWITPVLPFNLAEYYLLLDLFAAVMIPYLCCFACSMAVLEEIDGNISPYLTVTPIGKTGYIFSRLVLPTIISAILTVSLLSVWTLTEMCFIKVVLISLSMAIVALITSMLVVVVAKNKIEGLAIAKVSGLIMIGIFIPFFMNGSLKYLFGWLPTFWIAKLSISDDFIYILPTILVESIWIWSLFKLYKSKME